MTDPEYYAAFHELVVSCLLPDPTGSSLIKSIARSGRDGVFEYQVAKRALREICNCDGSAVDAHEMCHWLELEGVPWAEAAGYADHTCG